MKKLKPAYVVGGLLVIGALVWLYFHSSSQPVSSASSPTSDGSFDPASAYEAYPYPNQDGSPISAAPIDIGGSPVQLTYNYPSSRGSAVTVIPSAQIQNPNGGGGCGCDESCISAGGVTGSLNIPQSNVDEAVGQLNDLYPNYPPPAKVTDEFGNNLGGVLQF